MKTIINTFAAATLCAFILQAPAAMAQKKQAKVDSPKTTDKKTITRNVVTANGDKVRQTITLNGTVVSNGDTTKLPLRTLENSVIILNNGTRYVLKNTEATNEGIKIEINGDSIRINGEPALNSNSNVIITEQKDIRANAINRLSDMNFMLDIPGIVNTFNGHVILGVATEKATNGVKIVGITKGSAAEKAGLKADDIINTINKVKINTPEELQKEINSYNAGNSIEIGYTRNNKQLVTSAVLQENKGNEIRYFNIAPTQLPSIRIAEESLGMMPNSVKEKKNIRVIPPQLRSQTMILPSQKWGITAQETEDKNGVLVLEVEKNSLAEKAGIQKNDIILNYKERSINSLPNLSQLMQFSQPGETVKISLSRKGKIVQTEVKIPTVLKTMQL